MEVNKEEIAAEGFEKVLPVTEKEEMKETVVILDEERVISAEELSVNRISPKGIHQDVIINYIILHYCSNFQVIFCFRPAHVAGFQELSSRNTVL